MSPSNDKAGSSQCCPPLFSSFFSSILSILFNTQHNAAPGKKKGARVSKNLKASRGLYNSIMGEGKE